MAEAFDTGMDHRLKLNGEMEHYKGVKRLAQDFGIIINPKGQGLAD